MRPNRLYLGLGGALAAVSLAAVTVATSQTAQAQGQPPFGGPGGGGPPGFGGPMGPPMGGNIAANNNRVYVLQGRMLLAFDAATLKPAGQVELPRPEPRPGPGGGPGGQGNKE